MALYRKNPKPLTDRWYGLKPIELQMKLRMTPHRFNIVPAGRRSGKTERAKRYGVRHAIAHAGHRYGFGAPTFQQAKSIWWSDLKRMTPGFLIASISESELTIRLKHGTEMVVFGMDKPQRVEGRPWDGMILDEYANMKESAWPENVRPALSDRKGWAWLIGVPEGRNHYFDTVEKAKHELVYQGEGGQQYWVNKRGDWAYWTWFSELVLDDDEIMSAMEDMDELTFNQEYRASFVNFEGQAYYQYDDRVHKCNLEQAYNPKAALNLCMDFNVDPGTAVITQEIDFPTRVAVAHAATHEVGGRTLFRNVKQPATGGTGILGEVYIPRNSNTPAVCRKFIQDWGDHQGRIVLYGDASGGNRHTTAVEGSDWDLVKREMWKHFGKERVSMKVPRANGSERARLNAMNARLMSMDGTVHMMIDPNKAPMTVRDLEGVRLLKGGSGEIDKKHDSKLTHLSDGLGYYVVGEFPVRGKRKARQQELIL